MAVSKKIKNMVKSCEDLKLQVELLQTTINKVVLKNELLSGLYYNVDERGCSHKYNIYKSSIIYT